MADKNCSGLGVLGTTTGTCCGGDKSTCIDVNKIYDSAKDKICIEDLRVFVGNEGQSIIDNASNIRCNGVEVIWAQISVHDIAFNKGYYSVDIRYYFRICFEACVGGNAREFCGIAVYDKSTILFGGDGNVSIFTSEATSGGICAGCLTNGTLTESVSNINITLVTMKKSDKRDGYILRLINNYKDSQEAQITVGAATETVVFTKYEVKTLFYDGKLHQLDLMEI